VTQTALLQFSYPKEKSPDTDNTLAIQLPNRIIPWNRDPSCSSVTQWTIHWHRQPSCISATQLKILLPHKALLRFSYTTEQSPNTNSPPAAQLPNWTVSWHT
jgi:hypothetical protein